MAVSQKFIEPVHKRGGGLGNAELHEQGNEGGLQDSGRDDANQQNQQYDGPLNLDYIVREYKRIYTGDLGKHGIDLKRNITAIAEMVVSQLGQVKNWHYFTIPLSKRAKMSKETPSVAVPDLGYRKLVNYYFDYHEKRGRVDSPSVMEWWALVYKEKNPPESDAKQRQERGAKLGYLDEILYRFLCNQENRGLGSAFLLKLAEAAGPENLELLRRSNNPLLMQAKEYLRQNWNMWCKPISLPAYLHQRLVMSNNDDDRIYREDDSEIYQAYKTDRKRFCLDGDDSTAGPSTSGQRFSELQAGVQFGQQVEGRHGIFSTCICKYLRPDDAEAAVKSHESKIKVLRSQLASVNATIAMTEGEIKKHKKLLKNASKCHMTLLRRHRSLRQLDKVTPDSRVRDETQIGMLNAVVKLLQINSSSGGVTEEDILHSVKDLGFKLLPENALPGSSIVSVNSASTSMPCESVPRISSQLPRPAPTVETLRSALLSVQQNVEGRRASGDPQPCTSNRRRQGNPENMESEQHSKERSSKKEHGNRDRRSSKSHSSRKRCKPKNRTRVEKLNLNNLFESSDSDSSQKAVFRAKENTPRKTTPISPLQNVPTKKPSVPDQCQRYANSDDIMEVTLSSD